MEFLIFFIRKYGEIEKYGERDEQLHCVFVCVFDSKWWKRWWRHAAWVGVFNEQSAISVCMFMVDVAMAKHVSLTPSLHSFVWLTDMPLSVRFLRVWIRKVCRYILLYVCFVCALSKSEQTKTNMNWNIIIWSVDPWHRHAWLGPGYPACWHTRVLSDSFYSTLSTTCSNPSWFHIRERVTDRHHTAWRRHRRHHFHHLYWWIVFIHTHDTHTTPAHRTYTRTHTTNNTQQSSTHLPQAAEWNTNCRAVCYYISISNIQVTRTLFTLFYYPSRCTPSKFI